MSFLCRVSGLTLRFQIQSSDIQGVEMVYASGKDISGMSKGVSGHVKLGRDPKQTQDALEELYLQAGQGMPWGPPRGTRGRTCGMASRKMDGWIKLIFLKIPHIYEDVYE